MSGFVKLKDGMRAAINIIEVERLCEVYSRNTSKGIHSMQLARKNPKPEIKICKEHGN